MLKRSYILPLIIIVGGVILVGALVYKTQQNNQSDADTNQEPYRIPNIEVSAPGGSYPEPVADLSRTLPDIAGSSPEAKKEAERKLAGIVEVLRKNPAQFEYWIELGLLRHTYTDYEGARDAYIYASQLRPDNALVFGNLAELYAYNLKDHAKAEEYYEKALKNAPKLAYIYSQAYTFYADILKNEEKTVDLLNRAIKNLPTNEGAAFREELKKYK